MPAHLILALEAPLISFGAEMVDAYGVVCDFPARSAITGLLANALGWERYEADRLDRLQARLVMGSMRVREGRRIQDYQTVLLGARDAGWTTRGKKEGRNENSPSFTYDPEIERRTGALVKTQTHQRYRDADADARLLVALRLAPPDEAPTVDDLAAALDRPERPLFVGRKPFLPSGRINLGLIEAETIAAALTAALAREPQDRVRQHHRPVSEPKSETPPRTVRAQWPVGEGPAGSEPPIELTDERNWLTGVHAGLRRVEGGRLPPAEAA